MLSLADGRMILEYRMVNLADGRMILEYRTVNLADGRTTLECHMIPLEPGGHRFMNDKVAATHHSTICSNYP